MRNPSTAVMIKDCIEKKPMTVVELRDELGIAEQSIRAILSTAVSFGAVIATRDNRSRLLRYRMSGLFK